ncbi:beta-COP [Cardiosporidium cionae]|uniref:Beta-COP n=1 Tax=Cardiosporidium cionae TaxID=476202 RepID=A0ABQ7JAU9_9APIC|nr:beta-COP [Cardiosporidium cionae]|eukprot:KAF8821121.1 beta-COP [Cardiosporidium cionae]
MFPKGEKDLSKVLEIEVADNEASLMMHTVHGEAQAFIEPNEPLFFRQLREKRGPDLDILDEDERDMRAAVGVEGSSAEDGILFQKRLQKVQQMTGLADPVYVEVFVQIVEFDLLVELTVLNRTADILQNVTTELFIHGDMKLVDRPASVTLAAYQKVVLFASIRVQSMDAGILFGYVTFDRRGSGDADFLVLNEFHVDVLDYIKKSWIGELTFRSMWAEFEWENKLPIKTSFTDVGLFLKYIMHHTHMTAVGKFSRPTVENENKETADDISLEAMDTPPLLKNLSSNTSFLAVNLYSRSIFGEDALANISLEKLADGKLAGCIRIRSRSQGVALSLGDRITVLQRKIFD